MNSNLKNFIRCVIPVLLVSLLVQSCKTTKYLQENEIILDKQKINLHPREKIDNKRLLQAELQNQLKQKPNTKVFGLFDFKVWMHYKLIHSAEKSKFNKWFYNAFSKPPILVDSSLTIQTRDAMAGVMFNNGFYNSVVEYQLKKTGKQRVELIYNVFPETPFKIRKLLYISKDTAIQPFLAELQNSSLINKGQRLHAVDYELETIRMVRFFKNNGYANFDKIHIAPLFVDTIAGNLDITLELLPPGPDLHHKKYHLNNIQVYTDYTTNEEGNIPQTDTIINGIRIFSYAKNSPFKASSIQKLIYFYKDDLYNQSNIDFTNKKLSNLPCFKFIKIKTDIDSVKHDKININVLLTPSEKYSAGLDYDLNWETNSFLNQALLGTAISFTHKSKNIFKGGEQMNFGIETGIAINPNPTNAGIINTIDFKLSNEIKIPRFLGFLGFYNFLNKVPTKEKAIISDKSFDQMKKLATTSILSSYNYTKIINLYDIQALNLSYGIYFQKSNIETFQINHLAISFLNTQLAPIFDSLIVDNVFLQKSLAERQLFTGLLFRDFTYTYASPPNRWLEEWYARVNFEVSGAEVWAVNSIINILRKSNQNFSESLKFAQYFKLELEGRYTKKYTQNYSFAYRLYAGILVPYGFTAQTPYVKQFFVGGPNSLRAWRIRELGPGKVIADNKTTTFYQTGDFKLETNAELRFNIFWYLKGAVFVDIGNVWDINKSSFGSDGLLGLDFYKYFGVGSGVGLRADFNFFQIRFDAGIKMAEPGKWVFDPRNVRLSDFNPNIAIGYPF